MPYILELAPLQGPGSERECTDLAAAKAFAIDHAAGRMPFRSEGERANVCEPLESLSERHPVTVDGVRYSVRPVVATPVLTIDHELRTVGATVYYRCHGCRYDYVRGKITDIEFRFGRWRTDVKCSQCKEPTQGLYAENALWARRYRSHFTGAHNEINPRCSACGWL
jgi:hypothetical protein